jgi:cation diffusion facilitator family transporter
MSFNPPNLVVKPKGDTEKSAAALSSVIAAICLTTFKLIVGLATNSLGILAEALHSTLDLVAAIVTLIAVRVSGKPADREHLYGHGKVENLSALFETLLLFVTCIWIIYESVQRLFFKHVIVDASIWAFIVMAVSIAIDFTRSRILGKAAKKFNSQALEADALHFSTDIWSSSVVILGLIGVRIGEFFPKIPLLGKADAIAALGVACIIIYISYQLGYRAVQGLLDKAPQGLAEKIKTVVEKIPGVANCHQVRVRPSGPEMFVDVHILVDKDQTLEEAHELTKLVEAAIQKLAPGADVTVHPEPLPETETDVTAHPSAGGADEKPPEG